MLLFLISFLLVFISSYLLTSVISPRRSILGLIYIFLIAFAQIVLTFEILSLFTAIKQFWVLTLNVLFVIISSYIWHKKSRPLWSLDYKDFRNKVINSFKLDKSLMWLYVGFGVLIITSLILCLIMPITNADAQAYHVARSLFWVLQGSLNHFDIADIRNLCLPINSEILYAWILLFIKKDVFLGFFSFIGYLLSIISIYNILGLLGYCTRKKLWVIFILSSFASTIVQLSSTETDIIIAGLILSSIFLFWFALKNNKAVPLFMSSLAYALAIGTKTTSLIAIPGVGLLLLTLSLYSKKYKPFILFLVFGFINFLTFSAYNYVLNFVHFGNFMGSTSFMVVSKNYFGIKGMFANFIKYIFMLFDFTGFRWSDYIGPNVMHYRDSILNFLHLGYIKDGLYTMPYFVNRFLIEPIMGAGILGFLVFLPCLVWGLVKSVCKFKSKKTWFIFIFSFVFIINLLSISYLLAYMVYSVRFIMSFMVISSPILVYSYLSSKNPLKYIIIGFSLFYLICVSTHLWPRPLNKIGPILIEHHSISYLRYIAKCENYNPNPSYSNSICALTKKITNSYSPKNKILAFISGNNCIYLLKILEFSGYHVDFKTLEDAKKINFNNYNLVIVPNKFQNSTLIKDYEKRKDEYILIGKNLYTNNNNTVPCVYLKNPNITNTGNNESIYPYSVECGMSKKFILEKNLEKITMVGLLINNLNEKDYNYYYIYRNKNLPLEIKKPYKK